MAAALPFILPAIAGLFGAGSALFAKKPSLKKVDVQSKGQKGLQGGILQLLQQMISPQGSFGQGQNFLQNLLSNNPESTKAFEAPYLRQFNEQTVPGLAERFAGLGALSSSGFQQALGQAGAGLSEQLASLRSGLQMQGLGQSLGLPGQFLQSAFQSPFALQQNPGGGALSSALGGFGQGIAPGLGQISGLQLLKNYFPNALGGSPQKTESPGNKTTS